MDSLIGFSIIVIVVIVVLIEFVEIGVHRVVWIQEEIAKSVWDRIRAERSSFSLVRCVQVQCILP